MNGALTNGHANGINGHTNGVTNGHANGLTNGNGTTKGLTNGHTNGTTNGHINGHANGHSEDAQDFMNPALKVTPDHQLKMVDAPIEEPGPGEVTLQIKCSGICGWVA